MPFQKKQGSKLFIKKSKKIQKTQQYKDEVLSNDDEADDSESSLQSISSAIEDTESESSSSIHLSPEIATAAASRKQKKERKHGEQPSKVSKRFRSSQVEVISEMSAETGNDSFEKPASKKKEKKALSLDKKKGKQGKQEKEVDLEESISISSGEDDDEDSAELSSLDDEEESGIISEDEPQQITSKSQILKEKKTFQQEKTIQDQPKQQKLPLTQKSTIASHVESIVENKSLTINEMEAMSKLLSIQADGLKRKQQQQQSKNSLNQTQKQAPKTFLGQLPVKKVKSEMEQNVEVHNKQQIVKKNITALINQLPSDEDVYEDLNLKNRQFPCRQKKQEQELSTQQMYQGAFPQYQNRGQQYPVKQNITPIGKTGKLTPNIVSQGYLGQGMAGGKISACTMQNIPGKLTPMIRGNMQNQFAHQREQQLNNLVVIESEIQSRIETIKNEIGPLLACLNTDVLGGMGASFHQNQLLQEKQQFLNTNSNSSCLQADPYLNSRIYQDLTERRAQLQLQDQEYQAYQLQLQQQQIQQQLQMKLEQERQLELQQQQEYEYIQMMNFQNQQERIKVPAMAVQNIRQNQQQEQQIDTRNYMNSKRGQNRDDSHEHQQQIGRNYDARAGDWLCGNCKNFNFAYREICNRCGLKQDENISMVHPQITQEALDLIHELNHNLKKQQNISTDENKRVYRNGGQNKENNCKIISGNSKDNRINQQDNFKKQAVMYQQNQQARDQQQVPKRQSLFQQQQQKQLQKQHFLF